MTITAPDTSTAIPVEERLFGSLTDPPAVSTAEVIGTMLDSGQGISDLIFSPGRPPQVEKHGQLTAVPVPDLSILQPADTARLARDLIRNNEHVLATLKNEGACDLSYSLPERARFRVNI